VVHPQAFVEAVPADRREAYLAQARKRSVEGQRRLVKAMVGGGSLYERPADRRFGGDSVPAAASRQLEADVLLTEAARLGADDVYSSGLPGCK
jgi:fatty acid synthase